MRFNKIETCSRGRNNKSAVRYLEFGPASLIKQGDGLQSDVILPIRGQDVAHHLVNASINIKSYSICSSVRKYLSLFYL